ncbi:hypothetical protein [Dysgonomonas massiliensis]|nr:hypothetical protein [Dysgonomonas massiliensis]
MLNSIPPYRGLEDKDETKSKTNKPKKKEKKEPKIIHWEQIGFGR